MSQYHCLNCGDTFSGIPGFVEDHPLCMECKEDPEGWTHFHVENTDVLGRHKRIAACGRLGLMIQTQLERVDCPKCLQHPEYTRELGLERLELHPPVKKPSAPYQTEFDPEDQIG